MPKAQRGLDSMSLYVAAIVHPTVVWLTGGTAGNTTPFVEPKHFWTSFSTVSALPPPVACTDVCAFQANPAPKLLQVSPEKTHTVVCTAASYRSTCFQPHKIYRTAFWVVVLDVALPVPKVEGVATVDFVGGDQIVVDARRGRVNAGEARRSIAGKVAAGGPVIIVGVLTRITGALATITRIVV